MLLIDRWAGQGATDYVNTINLTGGIPYDIQIDYHNRTGQRRSESQLVERQPAEADHPTGPALPGARAEPKDDGDH